MIFFRSAVIWTVLAMIGLTTACARVTAPTLNSPISLAATRTEKMLRAQIHQWQGVSHRMGGTSRKGIDCSAFVMKIYQHVFHIQLARTTRQQVRAGTPVSGDQLRAEDLVFFYSITSGRHVGIYLNNGHLSYVSKSYGVRRPNLTAPYWRRVYRTARRIVN